MSESVLIPGARDVRATLTDPGANACVVACPPHPQMGGTRSDARLTAVSDALEQVDIASLRFDYGEWAEGKGERTDAVNAVEWARDHYDRVGLYGFSFGGAIALLASTETGVECVSALAPASRLSDELDAVIALDDIDFSVQVVYAERDSTADWEPVVERARELDFVVESMSADHFFLGQEEKAAERVVEFLCDHLG